MAKDSIRAAAEKTAKQIQWLTGPQIPWKKEVMDEVIHYLDGSIRRVRDAERERIEYSTVHHMFYRLWTMMVGRTGYVKEEWAALEKQLVAAEIQQCRIRQGGSHE